MTPKILAIIRSSMILCTMSLLLPTWQQLEGANSWNMRTNFRDLKGKKKCLLEWNKNA